MATSLKKRPRPIEKAKVEDPKVVGNPSQQKVGQVKDIEPENSETEAAEVTNGNVANASAKTDQVGGLDAKENCQKTNPDFEPEFDGDLEHVSWVPMRLFGEHKGF